ncbi:MAG: UbiX family flavin prenyltransferase [Proteobacteria bacterium]|nr:UbiX family flavin prenyltransferase [Pseudomonadota bacterium]
MRLVVGISGASGAPYAKRMLQRLAEQRSSHEVQVLLSRTAEQVWAHECDGHPRELGWPTFAGRDYDAACASGSAGFEAMVVIPASMSCVARVAHGISDDLLTRAADVVLKERRKLIVVPREAPYSALHMENMLALTRLGVLVIPASPAFYAHPTTIRDLLDTVIDRVFVHLGLSHSQKRWGYEVLSRHKTTHGNA